MSGGPAGVRKSRKRALSGRRYRGNPGAFPDARTLALTGLAVREHGRRNGDEVVVPLPVEGAGVAMDAADG